MPAGWENFFIAEVGATAALAGLVIVAISINLSRIPAFPELPGRAAEAIVARTYRTARASGRGNIGARILLAQINTLPFVIAGTSIALGNESGFYWLSAGAILALIGGMLNTWVLLEILR